MELKEDKHYDFLFLDYKFTKGLEFVINRLMSRKFDWFNSFKLNSVMVNTMSPWEGIHVFYLGVLNVDENWGKKMWIEEGQYGEFPGNRDYDFDKYSGVLLNELLGSKMISEISEVFNFAFRGVRPIEDEPRVSRVGRLLLHFDESKKEDNLQETIKRVLKQQTELKERCWKGYTQKGMKTMFGKRYPNCVKKKKIHEEINAKDAYNEYGSVKTIVDGKRNIAFTTLDNPVVRLLIKMNGLKKIKVESSDATNYVIYKEGSEKDASELVDIANKYGGTLNYEASEEDSRRIGQILGYIPQDIDDYIQHNKKIRGISENNSVNYIIKKVLKETTRDEFIEKLKIKRKKVGLVRMRKDLGGLDEYIKILHDGDYEDFFQKEIRDKFDDYLSFLVNNYYKHPCEYENEHQMIEVIKYAIIERMYYDYFGDLDDNGKEWREMFNVMDDHIYGSWGEKLSEYYNLRC